MEIKMLRCVTSCSFVRKDQGLGGNSCMHIYGSSIFHHENGNSTFLLNVFTSLWLYMTPYSSRSLPYVNMLRCYFFIQVSFTARTKFLRVFLENRYKPNVLLQLQPSHNSYPSQHASLFECTWTRNFKKVRVCISFIHKQKFQKFFYQNLGTDLAPIKISQRRIFSASTFWALLANRRCVSYSLCISSLSIAGWVRA